MSAATIKLHLRFGETCRLRIVEISNLSVLALAAPRTDFDSLLERPELARAGVYLLLGEKVGKRKPLAYIGEAENVRERLKQHSAKDFWKHALILTDKDENLTKAHVRYLEGRLIQLAKASGRYEMQNTQGSGAKLPESEKETTEFYLSWILQLLPVLGCDLLFANVERQEAPESKTPKSADFRNALEGLGKSLNSKHREMLRTHFLAPAHKLTARQMAEKIGYAGYAAANLHYGRLGRLLGKKLGLPEEDCHIGVLVDFVRPNTEGNSEWIWILHPELAKALEDLGWI